MIPKFFLIKKKDFHKYPVIANIRKHKRIYISKNTGTFYYIIGTVRPSELKFKLKNAYHQQNWNLYKKKKLGVFTTLVEAILNANKDQECLKNLSDSRKKKQKKSLPKMA